MTYIMITVHNNVGNDLYDLYIIMIHYFIQN